jgi:mono/diheme cytochrome c family protein
LIRNAAVAVLFLLAGVVSGCGDDSPADVGAGDPDRPVFEARCAVCHGLDGAPRWPSALSGDLGDPDWHAGTTERAIREVILDGRREMPSFSGKLTDEESERIVGYVQRLPTLKSKK